MVRLMLNAGRQHGIQPGDVVGAIAGEAGIPGRAIGAIDIQADETFVDVKDIHVDRVLKPDAKRHACAVARLRSSGRRKAAFSD